MSQMDKLVCNCCGQEYLIIEKEFCHITKQWGYFSHKDGRIQEFWVCEECYDKWLEEFTIPPEEKKATELI